MHGVMRCPVCQGDLQTLALGGQSIERCGICGAAWIGRETILALRGQGLADHPLLKSVEGASGTERARFDQLDCPSCGAKMRVYDYRGGAVTVDQCVACDHIFLDAGELAGILKEWDEGFELSDEAKQALMVHHLELGAATEGPGWTLLVAILGAILWFALRLFGVSHEMGLNEFISEMGSVKQGKQLWRKLSGLSLMPWVMIPLGSSTERAFWNCFGRC